MISMNAFQLAVIGLLGLAGVSQGGEPLQVDRPLHEGSQTPDVLYVDFDKKEDQTLSGGGGGNLRLKIQDGAANSSPGWTTGPTAAFGGAMTFDYGSTEPFAAENAEAIGNHLAMAHSPSLDLAGESFTMGAWVKVPEMSSWPASARKHIISKGGYSPQYPGYGLYLKSWSGNRWFLVLQLVDDAGGMSVADDRPASQNSSAELSDFKPGEWHHIAASFDAQTEIFTLSLDGVPIHHGMASAKPSNSSLPLFIGERGTSHHDNIPIILDEVFITKGAHEIAPISLEVSTSHLPTSPTR